MLRIHGGRTLREEEYLGISRREGGPILPRLVMVPLQIHPHIVNLITETSGGLGPDLAISLPLLSHNPICLVYLSYKRFIPFPSIVTLPLVFHQPLHNIPPPLQQRINPPFQIHIHQLPISPYLLIYLFSSNSHILASLMAAQILVQNLALSSSNSMAALCLIASHEDRKRL